MKPVPIDQTKARISKLVVDGLDQERIRDEEHLDDATQLDPGSEGEEYMVVLVRGAERDSVKKLEVFFIPERKTLQCQMNYLLAEGYRAAAGSPSSDLQLISTEVRRLDPSGNPIARQFMELLGDGSLARSPTSSLISIAASGEDADTDTESADLLSADQMIMDLLEEGSHSERSSSPSTIGSSSTDQDACISRSARPESPPPQSPPSPTGSNRQARSAIPPSLGLALRPRHVVRRSQAEPSDSSEPPARFDDLSLWIDHFNTLSTVASGLKLRDPLPGDKVSQNQAFLSFRNLFIELFSFSTKGSMIGVPAAVSHFVNVPRLVMVTDDSGP